MENKLDLAGIKARLAAATPGPWGNYRLLQETKVEQLAYVQRCIEAGGGPFFLTMAEKIDGPCDVAHTGNGPTSEANATFIAHAPADIAALVRAVEEAKVFARQFIAISEELHGVGPCSVCDNARMWLKEWS